MRLWGVAIVEKRTVTENTGNEFPEIRDLWQLLCSIYGSKGIDLPRVVRDAARRKRQSLSTWACDADFDELCRRGCSEIALALGLWILASSRLWGNVWRAAVGLKRNRDRVSDTLENAASALEHIQNSFESAVFEDIKARYAVAEELQIGFKSPEFDVEAKWPENSPAPHPHTVIKALRLYTRLLRSFENIADESGINSPESLAKYLISAYVKRVTGTFHDPEVSALIGSILKENYDETAHRMWRSRNYSQIEASSSSLAQLLLGIGKVLA